MASLTDIDESFNQGAYGVKLAMDGETASMVCLERVSNEPYESKYYYLGGLS